MRVISADQIDTALSHRDLIETLRRTYRSALIAPAPDTFTIARPETSPLTLSAIPSWTDFERQGHTNRGYIGCRLAIGPEQPGPASGGGPGSSVYLLFSGATAHPIAVLDGVRLTRWSSCATHALAASYLAREDSERLLIIGDHPLVVDLVAAHATVRSLRSILLAGGSPDLEKKLCALEAPNAITVGRTDDIGAAAEGADMVLAASVDALAGAANDLPVGIHIDLLGATGALPSSVSEECRLFVGDRTRHGLGEADEIAADLRDLAQGHKAGRRFYGQRTLFAAGPATGIADMATAGHVFLKS